MYNVINGSFISEDLFLVLIIFQIKSIHILMLAHFGPPSFKILELSLACHTQTNMIYLTPLQAHINIIK